MTKERHYNSIKLTVERTGKAPYWLLSQYSKMVLNIQNYLRSLVRRGELGKELPRNAKPARDHGLPKIHKTFDLFPKFRPIIDTCNRYHALLRW